MQKSIHILIAGNDPALEAEFEAALVGVKNHRAVLHVARDLRQADETARSRQPHLVCLDLDFGIREVETFAQEISFALPGIPVVVLYRPDRFITGEPESAVILHALRSGVRDFLRRPLSSTELRQLLDRLDERPASRAAAGKVISFISNKGGVGKSTLAVNSACALARRHPDRVLLVDASLQLGICSVLLDLVPETTIVDAVREKDRLDEALLRRMSVAHPCGLHLLAAPADAMEAAEINDEAVARILNLARRAFDYVIVDSFPMLDGIVLAILDLCDLVYVVMQGTAPSVVGILKLLPVLDRIGVPQERQRIALNHNYRKFAGDLTPEDIEQRLGREVDHFFPYQKKILLATNTGVPYVLRPMQRFGFGRAVAELVEGIETHRGANTPRGSRSAEAAKDDLVEREAQA